MKRLTGFFTLLLLTVMSICNSRTSIQMMTTSDTIEVAGEGKPCPDKDKGHSQKA